MIKYVKKKILEEKIKSPIVLLSLCLTSAALAHPKQIIVPILTIMKNGITFEHYSSYSRKMSPLQNNIFRIMLNSEPRNLGRGGLFKRLE
jgi:hypothetical protein